jgi:hypothetical protein
MPALLAKLSQSAADQETSNNTNGVLPCGGTQDLGCSAVSMSWHRAGQVPGSTISDCLQLLWCSKQAIVWVENDKNCKICSI